MGFLAISAQISEEFYPLVKHLKISLIISIFSPKITNNCPIDLRPKLTQFHQPKIKIITQKNQVKTRGFTGSRTN